MPADRKTADRFPPSFVSAPFSLGSPSAKSGLEEREGGGVRTNAHFPPARFGRRSMLTLAAQKLGWKFNVKNCFSAGETSMYLSVRRVDFFFLREASDYMHVWV